MLKSHMALLLHMLVAVSVIPLINGQEREVHEAELQQMYKSIISQNTFPNTKWAMENLTNWFLD